MKYKYWEFDTFASVIQQYKLQPGLRFLLSISFVPPMTHEEHIEEKQKYDYFLNDDLIEFASQAADPMESCWN